MERQEKREIDLWPAVWSAALALGLYAVTLFGTYVFDDRYIVQADPRINDPWLWGEFWSKDYFNGGVDNLYRPLVSMSYAIQAKLHGNGENRAWLFHLANLLLHAGVSGCVAELARRISSARVGMIAGLLFAAHPIHVEAVANIVGRAELMCALGIAGALLSFIWRPMTVGRAIDIWAWFVLALLSKEQGMLLPLALLIAAPLRRQAPVSANVDSRHERAGLLWLIMLLAWTLAAYVYLRENTLNLKFWWDRSFLDPTINPLIETTGWTQRRLMMPLSLLGRYVALLLMPVNLSLDYGSDVLGSTTTPADPFVWIGALTVMLWIGWLIVSIRRRRWLAACCLVIFAIFYSVVANALTLIGVNFAERLMYVPSIFFVILMAHLLGLMRRRLTITIVMIVIALYSVRTVTYAWRWNDRMRLYTYTVKQQPRSLRAHLLLAEELRLRKEHDRAEQVLARARGMRPDYWKLWEDSARNELDRGSLQRARDFIVEAARVRPTVRSSALYRELVNAPATVPVTLPAR